MKLVAGQQYYDMPEVGRPWGWALNGITYEVKEISIKDSFRLPRHPDGSSPTGYPGFWCDCRNGRFEVYPVPQYDLELIIRPLPNPAKLSAFVAQEIGA